MTGLSSAEYIKSLIIDYYLKDNKDIIIGNEIVYGIEQKMVDLVLLKDHNVTAIEVKAKNDSFKRLPAQLSEYQKIFSYIYLVVTQNHLAKAESMLPASVGLFLVDEQNDIKIIRKATIQNKISKMDILATINASFLRKKYPDFRKLDADALRLSLAKKSIKEIKSLLFDYLTFKTKPRFESFISEKGTCTHVDDIFLLSYPNKVIL